MQKPIMQAVAEHAKSVFAQALPEILHLSRDQLLQADNELQAEFAAIAGKVQSLVASRGDLGPAQDIQSHTMLKMRAVRERLATIKAPTDGPAPAVDIASVSASSMPFGAMGASAVPGVGGGAAKVEPDRPRAGRSRSPVAAMSKDASSKRGRQVARSKRANRNVDCAESDASQDDSAASLSGESLHPADTGTQSCG